MSEVWKDIPGYEGLYQVSDLGRVRSLDRIKWNGKSEFVIKGKILKTSYRNKNNREYVELTDENKKRTKINIHILVAIAFIGPRPESYAVCHIDGNPLNNKLSNIRYDSNRQNQIDVYRQGRKSGNGKLTIEQVLEIRKLYSTGDYTKTKLGEMFEVHSATIGKIINRKRFSWLNDDGSISESKTAVS